MNDTLRAIVLCVSVATIVYSALLYWRRGARDDTFLAIGLALFVLVAAVDAVVAAD